MDVKQHLIERGMNPYRYHCSWDNETACFYLFNTTGQIVGYQQYRPGATKTKHNDPKDGRYYTHVRGGTVAVWGIESFNLRKDILFVTEGIFDACKLHNLGLPAIAALANDPKQLRSWFYTLKTRTIVGVCDNDPAGRRLASSCHYAILCPEGKDLGDMSDSEVRKLIGSHFK